MNNYDVNSLVIDVVTNGLYLLFLKGPQCYRIIFLIDF